MPDDYYVYLLVDQDPRGQLPDKIFYVGKGRDSRALHHVLEHVRALEQHDLERAQALHARGLGTLDAGGSTDVLELEHEKLRRIGEIRRAGREVRIDLLRAALTSATAYAVESAAIDVLGIDHLANKVAGHEHFRAPAAAVDKMLNAEDVTIDEAGLQVTVAGVWGGASIAGLVDATDPAVIWENARQSWSLSRARRAAIDQAAQSGLPRLLVAVSKGPSQLWGGIILGLWELSGTRPGSPRIYERQDGSTYAVPGWEFLRIEHESPRLARLRHRY